MKIPAWPPQPCKRVIWHSLSPALALLPIRKYGKGSATPDYNQLSLLGLAYKFVDFSIDSLPPGTEESREIRERMGIMVHYNVKIRCVVSFGS